MARLLRRSLLVFALAGASAPSVADAEPHLRTGFCAGIGFGMESVSWTDSDGDRSVEGSGVMNARAGWALEPDFVLGVEFWGWAKEYDLSVSGTPVPAEVQLTAVTACATWFPGAGGFFTRLGAGLAYGKATVDPPPSVTELAPAEASETGFALNLAPGYEYRFTRRFALGAQGDLVYFALGGGLENTFGYGVNAQFNWYW